MIDLTSKGLPNTISVQGKPYSIYTDFRTWIKVSIMLQKAKPGDNIDLKFIFKNEYPRLMDLESLRSFLSPPHEIPRQIGPGSASIILDYEIDADLIWAACLGQYGVDLVDVENLHWWKFLAMIQGLNNSTKLREVMGYRCYTKRTDKTDPYEELRLAWEIVREQNETTDDSFSKAFEVPEE